MYVVPEPILLRRRDGFLEARQASNSTTDQQQQQQIAQTWTYVVAAVIAVIIFIILTAIIYTYIRRLKVTGRTPRYIPTQYLKHRWEAWQPVDKYANISHNRNASDAEAATINLTATPRISEATRVDRHTSVRSVMTLPSYSQDPKDTEEIIGREGERGGIDTVIELPENAEEAEDRREQEMESLYQIRQARRREITEREERRRERREARERGDFARLDELRREARQRREQNSLGNLVHNSGSNVNLTAQMLIAEHNSRGRDRRVSEVAYAAVGQVRHDGSRIRSHSNDSERNGLLNGAAPMGAHGRNTSEATLQSLGGLPQPRYRDRSHSAATSISTIGSSFEDVTSPSELARTTTSRTGILDSDAADISSERIVVSAPQGTPLPPEYDIHDWGEAPQYTGPSAISRSVSNATENTQNDGMIRPISVISALDTLSIITPSIHIQTPTGPNTPMPRSPVSPIEQP